MTVLDRSRLAVTAALLVLVTWPQSAFADPETDDSVEACASAAERGQAARNAGKLLQARSDLRACAVPLCPPIVQVDCLRWLAEIEEELPSVAFRARDARDSDVVGVRVYANGELLAPELDGKPITLDPGHYELRYEARSGSASEETIVLRRGEGLREISIRFKEALESDGSLATPRSASPPKRARPHRALAKPSAQAGPSRARSNTLGYVFGAAGLATLGGFTYFELSGQARYDDLRSGCGRTQSCPEDEVDAARTDFVLAGSFLAASAVLVGLSTWQFLRPRQPSSSAQLTSVQSPATFAF